MRLNRRDRHAALAILVAIAIVASVVVVATAMRSAPQITASSAAPGSRLDELSDAAGESGSRNALWTSVGETRGATLTLHLQSSREFSRIVLRGPSDASEAVRSVLLSFDGGDPLLVTADPAGDVDSAFPSRRARAVTLTVATASEGARTVALAGWSMGSGEVSTWSSPGSASIRASSSAKSSPPAPSLVRTTRSTWRPDASDSHPRLRLAWHDPVELTAIAVVGASSEPRPAILSFSDGSSLMMSGVGLDGATRTAFTARVVTSLTIRLAVGARVDSVLPFGGGGSVGRGSSGVPASSSAQPSGDACANGVGTRSSAAAVAPTLVCPTMGSTVGPTADVVVAARPGAALIAEAWRPSGHSADLGTVTEVATAEADPRGEATLRFSTLQFARGPMVIRIRESGSSSEPLYVQLVNSSGVTTHPSGFAPKGMTLQYDDEFDGGLSISRSGHGTRYAAVKPTPSGGEDFGDAVFADPAWGTDTFSTVGGALRISAGPLGQRSDPSDYGRKHLGGIVSSQRLGGTGFSAQYGYFEARMLGAPGPGAWPAFWMLNAPAAAIPGMTSGEVDAVELYGHDTRSACHSIHNYGSTSKGSKTDCPSLGAGGDWALAWHTYAVQVSPDSAKFFIDGDLVSSLRGFDLSAQPYFFMLDLALGGGWPVDLSATDDRTGLYVDYVRVYT